MKEKNILNTLFTGRGKCTWKLDNEHYCLKLQAPVSAYCKKHGREFRKKLIDIEKGGREMGWKKDKLRMEYIEERDKWLELQGYGKEDMEKDIFLIKEWYKKERK